MRATICLLTTMILLAGCNRQPGNSGNAAAPANAAAPVNQAAGPANNMAAAAQQSRTVSGTMAGWEMGDYPWARIDVAGGEPVRAMVEGDAIGLFLDANQGRPVTVEVTTAMMNVPEAGGQTEIARITAARNAAGSAQTWLDGLSPAARQAAQRHFEEGALSSGAR